MSGEPTRICPACGAHGGAEFCPKDGALMIPAEALATAADGMIGRVIRGRYRLVRTLGAGGMGKVYAASQLGLQREVAVKVLRRLAADDPTEQRAVVLRFQREVLAASRLQHPNTIRVYDYGTAEDGTLFLVMELLEGRTLGQAIREGGPMEPCAAARVGAQVCRSLAEAHEHGIVHRDLKPDNVFLVDVHGGLEQVKVLDFGIAKIAAAPEHELVGTLTTSRTIVGTAAYMAPEQAEGGVVTPATDLYALGVILYQAVTGALPFEGKTSVSVMVKRSLDGAPALPASVQGRAVPPELGALVRRLLARAPAERPASALEVALELEALAGLSTAALVAAPTGRRPLRAHRWVRAGVAVLAAGVCAAAGAGLGALRPAALAPAAVVKAPAALSPPCPTPTCPVPACPAPACPAPTLTSASPSPGGSPPVEVAATGAPVASPAPKAPAAQKSAAGATIARHAAPSLQTPSARPHAARPEAAPACDAARCPFTTPCRHTSGRVLKGDEFCFPAF